MSWPLMVLDPTIDSIRGVRTAPLLVALWPITACMKSGMNNVVPNMATAVSAAIAAAIETIELRNRLSGIIGSAARRSVQRNAAVMTAATASIPTMVGDPHGYRLPPQ